MANKMSTNDEVIRKEFLRKLAEIVRKQRRKRRTRGGNSNDNSNGR